MCYVLTLGTHEPEARLNSLIRNESTLTARGYEQPFWLRPSVNPSVKALFPASDRVFEVHTGQCSCDLMPSKRKGAPHEAFGRWLRKVAGEADGGVRVFFHWYEGGFDTERVRSAGTNHVPVDQLVDAGLLDEDRLIDIGRR